MAQAKKTGITVLQFHYLFFMMLNDLQDGMCVLGSRNHIPYFRMKLYTQMALRLRPLPMLYFGGKERQTCLEHSILNIVCSNLMCSFFFSLKLSLFLFSVAHRGSILDHIWTWRPQSALLMKVALSQILLLVRRVSPWMFQLSWMLSGVCMGPVQPTFLRLLSK